MQLRCNYHSGQWAEWHCEHCGRDFCRQCVPGGHDYKLRAGGPKCVLCSKKLGYLGSAVGAQRPTQQLVNNLLFPFQPNSLVVFSILVIVAMPFLFLLKTSMFGYGILPLFFVFTLIVEYAGAIMLARSEGEKTPPEWGKMVKQLDMLYLIKHVLMVGAGIAITKYCIDIQPLFGFLVGALFLFILPAALMILAIDRSLIRAMNPVLLLSMVRSFIKDYSVFYVVVLTLATFFWLSFSKLVEINAGFGLSLLWCLGAIAAIYGCYAMLGYLMFYYQYNLGNSFAVDRGPVLTKSEYEKLRALGDSDVLTAEGCLDEARRVLRATMDLIDRDTEVHQRYHDILLKTDDTEALNNHTNFYLGLLFEDDNVKTASKVFRNVRKCLDNFLPSIPEIRYQLAVQLRKELDGRLAIELLRSFHESFPDSGLIPRAYLLAAEILHEDLHDSHRAAALLNHVLTNYAENGLISTIKPYFQQVQKHL